MGRRHPPQDEPYILNEAEIEHAVGFVEHYDLYFNFLMLAFIMWILGWASDFTWARRLP